MSNRSGTFRTYTKRTRLNSVYSFFEGLLNLKCPREVVSPFGAGFSNQTQIASGGFWFPDLPHYRQRSGYG